MGASGPVDTGPRLFMLVGDRFPPAPAPARQPSRAGEGGWGARGGEVRPSSQILSPPQGPPQGGGRGEKYNRFIRSLSRPPRNNGRGAGGRRGGGVGGKSFNPPPPPPC